MPNLMPLSILQALSVFPFADEFPYVSDDETLELAQDIEANGLIHPVVLFQNEILDGRNRLRALAKTTITSVPVTDFEGDHLDAVDFVASLNLRRRDLDQTQRAFIGRAYKREAAIGGDLRRAAGAEAGRAARYGHDLAPGINSTSQSAQSVGTARDEAGAKAGVSGRYIDMADKVATLAPELVEQCRSGVMAITAALAEIKRRQDASPGATPGDKAKPANPAERFEGRVDRAVSNLSDAIADHAEYGTADDLRYVVEQLQGLIRQAERTFS